MSIRAARRDDFDAVTQLLTELGRTPVTPATEADCRAVWDEQVVDPDAHHLVSEDDQGITGFCALHFRDRLSHSTPEAWVAELIVTERARRLGIGLALLEEVQRRARERHCHAIVLDCGYRRAEAHHLFRTFRMRDEGKFFRKDLRPHARP